MHPRFSWIIKTGINSAFQQKYHIEVSEQDCVVWSSDVIESGQSVFVPYTGKPLQYATKYLWRVKVCVADMWSEWSEYAWFETALEKWNADFIEADDKPEESCVKTFRKKINISGELRSARIYATALGLYNICLNGNPISDTLFNPGWSAYNSRLLYQAYDVTDLFTKNSNVLTASVAPGWFKGDFGFINNRSYYGSKMAFSSQIELHYADGTYECISTDDSWQFSDSPIIYTEIYHGETYDARKENAETWKAVTVSPSTNYNIVPFDGVPVRRKESFKPIAYFTTPKGEHVLDFGQNIAGRVRFNVRGNSGDTVKLRHAEVLDREGNFYIENLRDAKCTDLYILKGAGIETYEPAFTFHGFRYVCVDEYPGELDPQDFTAIAIYSDMKNIGNFSCSDSLINQLHSNIQWGLKGNFLDIPTDCPQRDERLGWTGDVQVFINTASYLHEVQAFFRKWLRDLAKDQMPDGGVPFVIPDILNNLKPDSNNVILNEKHSSCGWGDAAVVVPWTLYIHYGDKRMLEEAYPSMRGWVEYIRSKAIDNLWNTGFHFGDWVALDAKDGSHFGATPNDLCATAYYAYSTELLAKTAEILGNSADADEYRLLHSKIVCAYQSEFFTSNGRLAARTQTGHILSLMFGLTPEKFMARTIDTLVELIEENGGHLVTGFLGTPYFLHVLSQNDRLKEAYALLQREEYPSWLYQIKKGATTIWEHLNGILEDGTMRDPGMNSFNHYAYGAIGDWLYQVVAGIVPLEPGFSRILISPKYGGTLTNVEAELNTPYGKITSAWKLHDSDFLLNVKVPPNTNAEICMPNGETYTVGSGEYSYRCKIT